MRGSWRGDESPKNGRGQRRAGRPGAGSSSSPFDFSDDGEQVDPVDMMSIRADDELLDALSSGRSVGPAYTHGFDAGMDDGYADDQQVLAMLAGWRADVESERFPELVSVDEASQAIIAGQRRQPPQKPADAGGRRRGGSRDGAVRGRGSGRQRAARRPPLGCVDGARRQPGQVGRGRLQS